MSPGDDVLVFTSSGTFRGERGRVIRQTDRDVLVLVEGESSSMTFERKAVVPLNDNTHMVAGD